MAWTRKRPLGLAYHDPTLADPGYTLFASVRGQHAQLLDTNGQIVHRWYHEPGIQYAYLLPNSNLLLRTLPPKDAGGLEKIGGSSGGLVELDWDSKVVWEYENPTLHHDYERLPNGNTVLLTWEKLPPEVHRQVRGGHAHEEDPELMWGDVVIEIDPAGRVVSRWASWEHLDFAADVICPLESHKEWTHANSIAALGDDELVISFRLTSTVGIFSRKTGEFRWKWGPDHLSHQHHATPLESGRILIFDNGAHRRRGPNYSQIVEVDPETDEVVWSYKAEPILAFYSFMVSGAERLMNGNTLVTDGAHGHLFEVTKDGEVVWEWISPFMLESAFGKTPAIFRGHRYPSGDPRFAGRELSPEPYAELNQRIASGEILGPGD